MIKEKSILAATLLLLMSCSINAKTYSAKIISMPDHLHFTLDSHEPGSTLKYIGEDKNNNDCFIFNSPTLAPHRLVIPKNLEGVHFKNMQTGEVTRLGILKKKDNGLKAYDADQIEKLQDVIDDEKIIKLPKSSETDNQPQDANNITQKKQEDPASSFPEHNNFFPENSEPTSVTKPPYNFWKDVLMASGIVTTAALGFYYLTRNIEACARYLAGVERWSQWKSNEPIESILIIKPEYLAKELIKDIKTTYYEEPNPIALFLQDLEEEYETILQWIQFRNRIRFFGLIGTQFDFMEQRLALLDHLRQAAHHWRAREMETKMAHSSM